MSHFPVCKKEGIGLHQASFVHADPSSIADDDVIDHIDPDHLSTRTHISFLTCEAL